MKLGPWRLIRQVAAGQTGIVYEAVHEHRQVKVAVKALRRPHAAHIGIMRREIHALSELRHPGVVRILDHGIADGLPWYAMEILEHARLTELLSGCPTSRALAERLAVCADLCSTLAYVHGCGIVHGDIKPDNVILRNGIEPVLVDFGLAARFRERDERASLDAPIGYGTPAYLAPEQILGRGADYRSDLYALGCLLYQAATGQPPFIGSVSEILEAHLEAFPPDPRSLNPALPEDLAELILRLTEKNPLERHMTAWEVYGALLPLTDRATRFEALQTPPHLHRPLIRGRQAELAKLGAWLPTDRIGVVRGPSGIGKTFLVSEFCRGLPRTLAVTNFRCSSETAAETFAPFRDILAAVVDACLERGSFAVQRLFGDHAATLAWLDPRIIELPGHEAVVRLTIVQQAGLIDRIAEGLLHVLGTWAEKGPMLLVIDDAQWLDEASRLLLTRVDRRWLARSNLKLLLVETTGDADSELSIGHLMPQVVHLPPLPVTHLEEVVGDLIGKAAAPTLTALVAGSDGNPLYVTEYVRAAVESGVLRFQQGQWSLASPDDGLDAVPVPDNVKSIVRARIARLPDQAQSLLDLLATFGDLATFERLERATESPPEHLLPYLTLLIDSGFVTEAEGGRLEFSHRQHADAILETQSHDASVALSRTAADTLSAEARLGPALLAAIARYRNASHDPLLELDARRQAGQAYFDRAEHLQAAVHLRRAAELALDHGTALDYAALNNLLTASLAALGANADAIDAAGRSLLMLGLHLPKANWHGYLLKRAIARPLARWNRSLRQPSRVQAELLLAPLKLLAQEFFFKDDLSAGLSANLLSLDLVEANDLDHAPLRVYPTVAAFAHILGLRRTAHVLESKGLEFLGSAPATEASQFWMAVSLVRGQRGDWAEAEDAIHKALDLHSSIWDTRELGLIYALLGHAQYFQAQYPESEATFTQVLDLGRRYESDQMLAWGEFSIARSYCARGNYHSAIPLLHSAERRLTVQSETQSWLITLGLLALAHDQIGNRQEALTYATTCLKRLDQTTQTGYPSVEAFGGILHVLLQHPHLRPSTRSVLRKFAMFSRVVPCVRPRYLYYRGVFLRASGRPRRAERALRLGFQLAKRMHMHREAAMCAGELMAGTRVPDREAFHNQLRRHQTLSARGSE